MTTRMIKVDSAAMPRAAAMFAVSPAMACSAMQSPAQSAATGVASSHRLGAGGPLPGSSVVAQVRSDHGDMRRTAVRAAVGGAAAEGADVVVAIRTPCGQHLHTDVDSPNLFAASANGGLQDRDAVRVRANAF